MPTALVCAGSAYSWCFFTISLFSVCFIGMNFACNLCDVVMQDAEGLDRHMLNKHRTVKKIRYSCGFSACAATFDNYRALHKHKRTKHPQAGVSDTADGEFAATGGNVLDDDDFMQPNQLKSLVGHFLLNIRADDKLSDKASEHLANRLEQFTSDFSGIVQKKITERLQCAGENKAAELISSPQFSDVFSPSEIFRPFRSIYQQDKYIRE